MGIMSTALVVYDYKFPANSGQAPLVPAPFSGRMDILPATSPAAMHPEAARSGLIVLGRQTGTYGPDARITSTVPPGLIVDIYA